MAGRILEMLLDRLEVKEAGGGKTHGQHVIMTSLVWPRPRIAERISLKTVDLKGKAVELRKAAWTDRIVFKEVIEGPFGIEFGVTERMAESQFTEFVRFLASSMMKLAGSEAEDVVTNAVLGGLVKVPFQFLSKMIAGFGEEGPKIIASGSLDLHSEKTWNLSSQKRSAAAKTFKVPLTVPEAIYKITRRSKAGRFRTRRRKLIEAGADNGVIIFTGKVYK
ncbi:hypothetical protein ACFLS1_04985 [Verrucomicrobiota bacterium]